MQSLMMVVGNFPPEEDSASVVAGKFAEALSENGWQVIVVAREKPGGRPRETGLRRPPDFLYTYPGRGYANYPKWSRPLLKCGCGLTFYRESLLYSGELRKAVTEVLRRHPVDLVLGVLGPPAVLKGVSEVSTERARRGIWYIDPATYSPVPYYRRWLTRSILRKQESAMISRLDYLFFHSPELLGVYAEAHPHLRSRMHLLYPGFDPQEVADVRVEIPRRDGILIGYFGNVRTPEARALASLMNAIQEMPEIQRRQFGFYIRGEIGKKQRRMLAPYLKISDRQFGWEEHRDRVPLAEVLREIQRCDLVVTSRYAGGLLHPSGKIFWYLGLRKPVIYIGDPESAEASLIRRAGAGVVFNAKAPARELHAFLERSLVAKEQGENMVQWNEAFLTTLDLQVIVKEFNRMVSGS